MEDKKTVKIGAGTTICIFIIILLIIALIAMYMFNNQKIKDIEAEKTALENQKDNVEKLLNKQTEELSKTETQPAKTENNTMEEKLANYIKNEFGPKNNMKDVKIVSYKEITENEFFSKVPGAPLNEKEIEEYKKQNPNVTYGYCIYSIELKDETKLTMEGSKPEIQEVKDNTFISEAVYTYNKTTQAIKFETTYGFGN